MSRFAKIGGQSLWFDEVVTMRLARQSDPAAMLALLDETDATRAPLHPLLLHAWVRVFGPSEASGRALSALCGWLAVLLVFRIGWIAFDVPTGLWSAWLAAVSPLLVQYSREVRMYAWLVLLSGLAWLCLFRSIRRPNVWTRLFYPVALIAIGYSHPLGLLMIAALGLASGLQCLAPGLARLRSDARVDAWPGRGDGRARARWRAWKAWWITHAVAVLALLPWIPNYLDHEPSLTSAKWLSPRYVLGLPIGFVGGNRWILLLCVGIVAWGLVRISRGRPWISLDRPLVKTMLLIWFVVPPALLYAGSMLGPPIFGQARYTLYVGPAYLILLGRGLSRLPVPMAVVVGIMLAGCSAMLSQRTVYDPGLKADWRAAARLIHREDPIGAVVVVFSEDSPRTHEIDVARYYLGPGVSTSTSDEFSSRLMPDHQSCWLAVGLREGRPVATIPPSWFAPDDPVINLPGLRLIHASGARLDSGQEPGPPARLEQGQRTSGGRHGASQSVGPSR